MVQGSNPCGTTNFSTLVNVAFSSDPFAGSESGLNTLSVNGTYSPIKVGVTPEKYLAVKAAAEKIPLADMTVVRVPFSYPHKF